LTSLHHLPLLHLASVSLPSPGFLPSSTASWFRPPQWIPLILLEKATWLSPSTLEASLPGPFHPWRLPIGTVLLEMFLRCPRDVRLTQHQMTPSKVRLFSTRFFVQGAQPPRWQPRELSSPCRASAHCLSSPPVLGQPPMCKSSGLLSPHTPSRHCCLPMTVSRLSYSSDFSIIPGLEYPRPSSVRLLGRNVQFPTVLSSQGSAFPHPAQL
jgi:hypothetical protein